LTSVGFRLPVKMVVPMTSHHQQQQHRTPAQQSPYAAGWTPQQQRPVSPVSSYDARSFSRQGRSNQTLKNGQGGIALS